MSESIDPCQQSLYLPEMEHDACGIGFVADLKNRASHAIISDALTMLENMEHRGACGCDPRTGDGAGILIQKPHRFLKEECARLGIALPAAGKYGVGLVFFPGNGQLRAECRQILNDSIEDLGLKLLGYRQLPYEDEGIGSAARSVAPHIEQIFVGAKSLIDPYSLERKLFVLRKVGSRQIYRQVPNIGDDFYIPSLSHRTLVYKGQLRTDQVRTYFPDLQDERVESALALIHSRFSTNTFPQWRLAQPFRYIAHNGEINTIKGNVNWMRAKERLFETTYFTQEELDLIIPICDLTKSDSRNLDSIIEMLVVGGRSLPHVIMMLIPEAWQENSRMNETRKAFYEYHASLMEPWDGPASICFTDGKIVGATLDRNGLRPSRYTLTKDHRLVMASETGALPVDPANVLEKGRLQPGKMFVADLGEGRIISDEEIKEQICSQSPYRDWLDKHTTKIESLPEVPPLSRDFEEPALLQRQQLFGYTTEDMKMILGEMAISAKEPVGSMGLDTPLAVLSHQSQHLSHYFKQLFAQVSNPPIDPIRERLVMSLETWIGGSQNLLAEEPESCRRIDIPHPILTNEQLEKIRQINVNDFKTATIDAIFPVGQSLETGIQTLCEQARAALEEGGANILIISDRKAGKEFAPIPALMATGAVHHYLLKHQLRFRSALLVETGDAHETHHFATLIGYGALAINPYLALDSLETVQSTFKIATDLPLETMQKNFIKAINYGLLKIFSKMGISTLQSYHGAQIFEILGLSEEVVETCFYGSISRISGLSFDDVAREVTARHRIAYPETTVPNKRLEAGGIYQWKRNGEFHLFNPESIHLLQHATKKGDYSLYRKYADRINDQSKLACTLRSMFTFKNQEPIPIEEVESKESIFRRFATGAMSFGSISHEAHSTLAIAMNRIGGKSNSGEGGEDEIRFERKENGDWERSAIKQVASGRFGVTSNYLTNADELQIKMAQGAKPGEGGQLPGHKVDDWIGRVRHSTPGVGLISPPPHHDIYSIEDLAQLIFDLKNANRAARISVKLVSEAGVGTIAAGVSKAHADHILISGHDGGTGASPISSIRHAGLPWELGLSEAHQTLVLNDLRSRVTLQADGQIRTGRDMAIATLLGAEEWGVATAALVVEGCIMMRKCHLNTCPVGVATQDKELRKRFSGKVEHVVNFFHFLAEDLREIMAELGYRTVNEMVGQSQHLMVRKDLEHWKQKTVNLKRIIKKVSVPAHIGLYKQIEQDHGMEEILDWDLLEASQQAIQEQLPVYQEFSIKNTDRAVGTLTSNEVSKVHGGTGLPEGTIHFKFDGSAGQSFGAFAAHGLRMELEGEANDYFGKGLSGAQMIVYPPKEATFEPSQNIIIGNVAFYGATSGEAFIRGIAGERFCVRNSGARAVVEGIGDHGCEYMTGGVAVILGPTGRNFAAGMSGGIAYVFDPDQQFKINCNTELIDFDPIEHEDIKTLNELIEKHYAFTGSRVALRIITDWAKSLKSFIKVMPRDYKKALKEQKEQQYKLIG